MVSILFRIHVRGLPERGRLGGHLVGNDQPIELRHGAADEAGVRSGVARVHAPIEVALDDALVHELERGHHGEVGRRGNLRPPVVAVVVFDRGVLAEPFLQARDEELRLVGVIAVGIRLGLEPLAQRRAVRGVGPFQICGMLVDQHAHVGSALDVGLAAQRVEAAAGNADVAQEQLQDGHGARVLSAVGVLRLAERVQNGAGLAGLAGGGVGGIHQLERLFVHAADAAHGVHVVAGIMLFELLENAQRILQGHVTLGMLHYGRSELGHALCDGPCVIAALGSVPNGFGLDLIVPAMVAVLARLFVPAAEETGRGIEFVFGIEQIGSIRVVQHVLVLPQIVFDDVVVQAAVERDIRARTNGAIDIGLLGRTGVARVDDDPLRAVLVGLMNPLRADGVVFRTVGADVHNDVGVLEVAPMARHRAATE